MTSKAGVCPLDESLKCSPPQRPDKEPIVRGLLTVIGILLGVCATLAGVYFGHISDDAERRIEMERRLSLIESTSRETMRMVEGLVQDERRLHGEGQTPRRKN